jgi:hypothetical protein
LLVPLILAALATSGIAVAGGPPASDAANATRGN